MAAEFRVLYTRDVIKKHKKFKDGFLVLGGGRLAELFSEERQSLATCRLPDGMEVAADADRLTCFDGYLVDVDEEVVVGGGGSAQQQPAGFTAGAAPPQTAAAAATFLSLPARTPAQPVRPRVLSGSGGASGFKPPLRAPLQPVNLLQPQSLHAGRLPDGCKPPQQPPAAPFQHWAAAPAPAAEAAPRLRPGTVRSGKRSTVRPSTVVRRPHK